jgi:succinate dehydrogenase/fumarate reductase flavoprotein subunit
MDEGAKFLRGDGPPDYSVIADREAADVRVGGPALVAMLFKGLLDRGVPVERGVAARDLVLVEGEVLGVRVDTADGSQLIGARKGVVLACGGFEWNEELVASFIGQPVHPLSPPHNVGDGLMMAMEAGAQLANMTSFWGQPALLDPTVEFEGNPLYQMGTLRSFPGVIVVNRHGRRFTNEGVTYQDFPKTLTAYDPVTLDYPNDGPQWLIFDQRVRDRAVILPSVMPGQPTPEWIASAATIEELAAAIDVDGAALVATVERWNEQVAVGNDTDFHRGTVRFETHMSGSFPTPRTTLAPVARGPFYAVQLFNGALGTSGGPRIDEHGRVLRLRGGVVDGLYAAGNAAACVFGPAYPGGGATIGPAMTFGYLAGRHVAERPAGAR